MNSQSPLHESWKPVVGYEGLYEVSDMGSVRSLAKSGVGKGNGGKARIISSNTNNPGGYERLSLSKDGVGRQHVVHRLVLTAFVGPCPDGMEGCHGPAGKRDNSLANLRWDTKNANTADKYTNGEVAYGERNGRTSLKEADVRAIRARYGEETLAEIGADYGITGASVWLIGKRQTWAHVT